MYEPPDALSRVMQGLSAMTVTNGTTTITRPEDGGYQVEENVFGSWHALEEWASKHDVNIHTGWSRVKPKRRRNKHGKAA